MEILKDIGTLFYIVSPSGTAVERIEDIPKPNYVVKAIPYFVTFILLEYLIQIYKNKRRTRINDGITSLSLGLYIVCNDLLGKGAPYYFYCKVYENWRIADLPWNSAVTWWIAAIGVDFIFYWVHRASHEINFFWAHHQVHHSSESYNLTTAVRQPGFQIWFVWIFYLPLALFIPPQIYMIHLQFNLLFQFWIHTEVIDSLGPLELILNTPKHHRIHHGSNRYCLDKNYAGWLIIWDKLFGTFAEEKPNEEIKYGLVEDVKSFNPFWLQFFYVPKIWDRMQASKNWTDAISVLLKGPGWTPGKPRLGDINEVPLFPAREVFDGENGKLALWKNVYVVGHFAVQLGVLNFLTAHNEEHSQITILGGILYILSSLTSIGFVVENRQFGIYAELFRCVLSLFFLCIFTSRKYIYIVWFAMSIVVWLVNLIRLTLKPAGKRSVD